MADALLSARGLSKTYGTRTGGRPALVEASLDIAAGEIVGVVGESGSGKTTLARCLALLERPSSGGVLFKGENLTLLSPAALRARRRAIQTVFQDPYASLNPRIRVGDAIAEVLSVHRLVPRSAIRGRVVELLDQVGLPASAGELYPADFSGGQRQRLCIARALAAEPEILIADEPVSSLDVSIRAQVLNLLLDLRERLGLAIILIGHDLLLIGAVAPRIAVMLGGQIVELLPAGVPLAAARHPYTRELLAAVRRLEPGARIGTAPAAAPAAMAARGCAYWSRCPHRGDPRCETQMPPLREVAPGHLVASFYDLPSYSETRGHS